MIYVTAIVLTPGSRSTVNIYKQTIHRTTQSTKTIHRTTQFKTIYLLTATGLTPGGSSTVHTYRQKIHRTTQIQIWLEGFLGFEHRLVKIRVPMN